MWVSKAEFASLNKQVGQLVVAVTKLQDEQKISYGPYPPFGLWYHKRPSISTKEAVYMLLSHLGLKIEKPVYVEPGVGLVPIAEPSNEKD